MKVRLKAAVPVDWTAYMKDVIKVALSAEQLVEMWVDGLVVMMAAAMVVLWAQQMVDMKAL